MKKEQRSFIKVMPKNHTDNRLMRFLEKANLSLAGNIITNLFRICTDNVVWYFPRLAMYIPSLLKKQKVSLFQNLTTRFQNIA